MNTEITVRKAQEADRIGLSRIIATGFEREFSALTKDMERMAKALSSGIQIDRFYVAEQASRIIGAAACTDRTGRAVYVRRPDLRTNLGVIKGTFSYYVLKDEFMKALSYDSDTGYVEFVTVSPEARGKGVAKLLLRGIVEQSGYTSFILDVTDTNTYAIRSYTTFGFVETHRVPARHPKQQGFNQKVFMRFPE